MKLSKANKYFFCCFLYLATIPCFAQELLVNVQYFSVDDGLADRTVFSIEQDDRGVMWLGTGNGIDRFDGERFMHISDQEGLLATGNIFFLKKRFDGTFWIQKAKGGVWVFDPDQGKVIRPEEHFSGFPPGAKLLDPDGREKELCFKTDAGQVFYLDQANQVKQINYLENLAFNEISFTPWKTILVQNRLTQKILELNEAGDTLRSFPSVCTGHDLYHPSIKQVRFTLLKLDTFTQYLRDLLFSIEETGGMKPIELTKEGRPLQLSDFGLSKQYTIYMAKDSRENFYLSVNTSLWFFDCEGRFQKDLTPYVKKEVGNTWIADHFHVDDYDRLWVGSGRGLFMVQVKNNPFQWYLHNHFGASIRGIAEISEDSVMICNYGGVKIVDKESGTVLLENEMYGVGLAKGKEGQWWAGLHGATLFQFDQKKHSFKKVFINKITSESLLPYYSKSSKLLYIAASNGLNWSDDDGESFHRFENINEYKKFQREEVTFFHPSEEGIWLASANGLYLLDEEKGIIGHHDFPFNHIKHFHEDKAGDFWLATAGGGLIHWNRTTNEKRQFTKKEGLSHNIVYAVYEDESGYLWLPGNAGLMQFEKVSGEVVRTFQPEDGITHEEFNTFAHFQASDGRLYFGGLNGVTAFYPQDLNVKESDAPFIVTQLQQFDDASGKLLNKTKEFINHQEITLDPEDKFFTIHFTLLDYAKRKSSYAWKIEELEEEWNYQTNNSIRINSLKYGNYHLRVKAKGIGGRWASNELRIPIVVHKPFYLRWQFLLISIGLLLLLVYGFIRWRLYWLQGEKEKLEALISERTAELSEKNKELEQLNRTKDRFFAIIAHDLRSPLISLGGIAKKVSYLMRKNRTDEIQVLGDVVEEAVTGVHKLLDNLLNWAMVQGDQFPYNPEVIKANEVLSEVVELYKNAAESKNIKLHFEMAENATLYCDRAALSTVIRNLVDNAIKYTSSEGEVAVKTFLKDNQTIIKIEDSGLGIAQDKLENLFVLKKEKGVVGTEGESGTGLGLVLCRELVEMNGGEIRVDSREGEGTHFLVLMPSRN